MGYNIEVIGKSIEVTKPIRDYIEEKIHKIDKLTDQVIDVRVRIDVQKLNHIVDIFVSFSHFKIKVGAITDDLYSAIDKAIDKLSAKMRKWKSRIQDHHAKGVSVTEAEVEILERASHMEEEISDEIVEENNRAVEAQYTLPKVVRTKRRPVKTLRLDEAVMKMELSDDSFMVYRSEEDRALKVIYKRRDGSYGVMAPA